MRKSKRSFLVSSVIACSWMLLGGCGTASKHSKLEKVVLETSTGEKERPEWARSTGVYEAVESDLFFKGTYIGQGSDRISTCYRMAEADIQVRISQEVNQKVKSELFRLAEGMSDRVEPAVLASLLVESKSKIQGLRVVERYFERAIVNGSERVECIVRAKIDERDFQKVKQGLTEILAQKKPEIQALLTERQTRFAKDEEAK